MSGLFDYNPVKNVDVDERLERLRKIVKRDGKNRRCPKGHTQFARLDHVSDDESYYHFFCTACGATWWEKV